MSHDKKNPNVHPGKGKDPHQIETVGSALVQDLMADVTGKKVKKGPGESKHIYPARQVSPEYASWQKEHLAKGKHPFNDEDFYKKKSEINKHAFWQGFCEKCAEVNVNPITLAHMATQEKEAGWGSMVGQGAGHLVNLLRTIGGGNAGRGAMIGGTGAGLGFGLPALGRWINSTIDSAAGNKVDPADIALGKR